MAQFFSAEVEPKRTRSRRAAIYVEKPEVGRGVFPLRRGTKAYAQPTHCHLQKEAKGWHAAPPLCRGAQRRMRCRS